MLDADPLLARLEISEDLAAELRWDGARQRNGSAQEPQYIGAAKRRHRVLDQTWVQLTQLCGFAKHEVDRPLALMHGPVVVRGKGREKLGVDGVQRPGDA